MKITISALGIGLAFAAPAFAQMGASMDSTPPPAATAAPAVKGPQISPSKQALKAIIELQTAVNAKDAANIPAKIAAAQAVAKSKEDNYLIAIFRRQAALDAKDNAALSTAVEAIVSSGLVDSTKIAALYMDLGVQQFNAKQFGPAAASFEHATTISPNDPQALELLGRAKLAGGTKVEASAIFARAIQARLAAGQKASDEVFRAAVQSAYDGKSSTAIELSRQWIAAYPTADSWRNGIAIYRNLTQPDVEGTLALMRLMQATGSLHGASDYRLFASAAAEQSNFNETKAVVDQGIAAKVIDPTGPLFRDVVDELKTKKIATEADLAEAIKMSPAPPQLLRIGDRYYGMGKYAEAAAVYKTVLAKPGVDKDVANLHLGMALARSGDRTGATAAFNAVSASRADIAKYWLLYLQTGA
jgi:Flp pilus assembly protein TadD